ncbi:hypothetical protein M3A74_09270 [Corynebacterium appendicis]|uniref:hypothetical protein n=1 Tax=Corynebacterium appendicis TaxID=163202 RepID=UPI00223BA016|nr:hypothetical protein [Corynebacterium appendicis]MCT1684988.1 hypothetical protein [Corynebacterium appendicis]
MLPPKFTRTFARRACVPVALSLALGLTACSSDEEQPTEPPPESSEAPEATESSEPTTSGAESEPSTESSATETTSSSRWLNGGDSADKLEEVKETFASLAPESLFDDLDTCTETSLRSSYDCSGKEIGQFQFFESEAMAKDTANVLEGLKSSTIVEETDNKLVGWSMIGRTAVITVVDVEEGKVLQQMMSSEMEDPRDRISELGLAEKGADESETAPSSAAKEISSTSKNA